MQNKIFSINMRQNSNPSESECPFYCLNYNIRIMKVGIYVSTLTSIRMNPKHLLVCHNPCIRSKFNRYEFKINTSFGTDIRYIFNWYEFGYLLKIVRSRKLDLRQKQIILLSRIVILLLKG